MPEPDATNTLSFSRVTSLTASATEEVGTSKIASTPSWSYQRRAIAAPTSGLFWWSAETSVTVRSGSRALKSAIAMRAATTAPGPDRSA